MLFPSQQSMGINTAILPNANCLYSKMFSAIIKPLIIQMIAQIRYHFIYMFKSIFLLVNFDLYFEIIYSVKICNIVVVHKLPMGNADQRLTEMKVRINTIIDNSLDIFIVSIE